MHLRFQCCIEQIVVRDNNDTVQLWSCRAEWDGLSSYVRHEINLVLHHIKDALKALIMGKSPRASQ